MPTYSSLNRPLFLRRQSSRVCLSTLLLRPEIKDLVFMMRQVQVAGRELKLPRLPKSLLWLAGTRQTSLRRSPFLRALIGWHICQAAIVWDLEMPQTGSTKYYSLTYGALPTTFSTTPNSGTFHFSFYATLIPGVANTPTVSAVNPNAGPIAGGTGVTITGTNFTGATAVSFGGTAAASFAVVSATSITATSPAHAAGAVDVTVTTPNGTSTTSSADLFTYQGATTTALSSSQNPSVFGQSVTFTATVSSASGTPSGTVTFKDGATTLGTGTLAGGVATLPTSSLAIGGHTITAVYGGDTNFTGSTSSV